MNMNKRQEFYDVLFNRGEGIAYQTDHGVKGTDTFYKTNKVLVHKGDQDDWRFDYQFYCINPIDHETDNCHVEGEEFKPRAKICNVTSYRNFAIEFDDDSIEEDEVEEKDGDRKLLLLLVLLVGLSAPLHKNRAPLSSQARSNN